MIGLVIRRGFYWLPLMPHNRMTNQMGVQILNLVAKHPVLHDKSYVEYLDSKLELHQLS